MIDTLSRIRELWPQTPPTNTGIVEIPNVGRDDLARLFAQLDLHYGVEVGTEYGLFAEELALSIGTSFTRPGLTCVDPYRAYHGYREHTSQLKLDTIYAQARERLTPLGVRIIRAPSDVAVYGFQESSLDFVYIDGNHSLLHVVQDLCLWTPKVRRGGIVAGHDWISRKDPALNMHVVEAVTAYVHAYRIAPLFVLGRKEVREGEIRDPVRSWMFVKL